MDKNKAINRLMSDPLFVSSIMIYSINKTCPVYSPLWNSSLIPFYLNDLLLIPVMAPLLLYFLIIINFRKGDIIPSGKEIVVLLVVWSIMFEFVGPYALEKGTADVIDIISYSLGGFMSWVFWNKKISGEMI